MKQKKMKLSLNKKVISNIKMQTINGGSFLGFCNTHPNDLSCYACLSDEPDCHSENPLCDCGTSGNCEHR